MAVSLPPSGPGDGASALDGPLAPVAEDPARPSGQVARHVAWNLAAVALPFAVGLLTIPVLTRELGPAERQPFQVVAAI